jgi:hypothetical protein
MSKDKWRDAAFHVIVDMIELHDPDDPDAPLALAVRTDKGAEITLTDQETDKVLGSWRIELVSLKETDEWTHVIMTKGKRTLGTTHKHGYGVVISRHRSAKAAAGHMQRRSLTRLLGYEIYKLAGSGRAIEVGDKLATTVDEDGNYIAFRPGCKL